MQVKSIKYLDASILLIDGARVFLGGWISAPAVALVPIPWDMESAFKGIESYGILVVFYASQTIG
jgi:hypothetical protein